MKVLVNLSALCRNWQKLNGLSKSLCGAVVKADAYGLGAGKVAEALKSVGCHTFFTATVEEAVLLRPTVPSATIYAMHGVLNHDEIAVCLKHNIRPVVSSFEMWKMLQGSGAPMQVAVHFDTGMHRLGVPENEQAEMFLAVKQPHALNICLVMSHFVSSEIKNAETNEIQRQKFEEICKHFPDVPTSMANSAGILLGEEYHGDVTRPGYALYGGHSTADDAMETVFEIVPRVLQVQTVKKAESVGYNATWVAQRNSKIATVEVGYADVNPLNCDVLCKSSPVPIVGRVSMDMMTLDVTDIDNIEDIRIVPKLEGLQGYHLLTSLKGNRTKKEYVDG